MAKLITKDDIQKTQSGPLHSSSMTDEDRSALIKLIESGKPLPPLSLPGLLFPLMKGESDEFGSDLVSADHPLSEEVYKWLSELCVEETMPTTRDHACMALREFMDPPCTREELLTFFRAFANAYVRLLEVRVDVAAGQPKSALASNASGTGVPDNMSLGFARVYPSILAARLNLCRTLRHSDPESMDLFDLYEFAGCTPSELASYLDQSEEEVFDQIEYCEHCIWGPTGRYSV